MNRSLRMDGLRFWFGMALGAMALLPSIPAMVFWFFVLSGVNGSNEQQTAMLWTAIAAPLWLLAAFCIGTSFDRVDDGRR